VQPRLLNLLADAPCGSAPTRQDLPAGNTEAADREMHKWAPAGCPSPATRESRNLTGRVER
jgi:hypothetical protein